MERVREDGMIRKRSVLLAIGSNWEGRRAMLAVELADRETTSSWQRLLRKLKQRGLRGVGFEVSDDHAGLLRIPEQTGHPFRKTDRPFRKRPEKWPTLPRNPGRIAPEWVVAFSRNQRPVSPE